MVASLRGREPGAEDRPVLEDVTKHAVKTVTENIGLCMMMFCEE
jgi:hypothetical protein